MILVIELRVLSVIINWILLTNLLIFVYNGYKITVLRKVIQLILLLQRREHWSKIKKFVY
ncbi:hypothetical protein CF137_06070 [Aeromonas sobria]|nr:hypothetical protein CF137_06070 [Aeromonas sobria]